MEKVLPLELWQRCVNILKDEIQQQHFNTWLRPLKVLAGEDTLCLLAPNRFVSDWLKENYLKRIEEIIEDLSNGDAPAIVLSFASKKPAFTKIKTTSQQQDAKYENFTSEKINPLSFSKKTDFLTMKKQVSTFITKCEISPNKLTNLSKKNEHESQKTLDLDLDFDLSPPSTTRYTHLSQITPPFQSLQEQKSLNHSKQITTTPSTVLSQRLKQHKSMQQTKQETPLSASNHDISLIKKTIAIKKHPSLNQLFTFDNFVEGPSNQLALSAAKEISQKSNKAYNPLFLYGGVGLGKTHLMHALGNHLLTLENNKTVVYLSSERFVSDMIKALQLNAINDFKRYYRSVDALLIDDIQFFSRKERSQEEFFHTFNSLLEEGRQIILTCDRYPKQISGIDERLKSRFGWGLTVAIEPPELETRVAILMKKAEQAKIDLPTEAAFFLAQRLRSNVRELEGALKRVIASAHFIREPISVALIREALKDLLALQDKLVSIDNIQRVVSEFYKIKPADILSKIRARNISFPRQISMALAKQLTTHSLPEIGDAHGGRDHTTVIHACRKIKELLIDDKNFINEFHQLLNILTT
ncbi:MAG: chromosomal replication initiator protein DnaA [Endozoicomonadaceae bacterium]|nr:chromosomal replication initiator protein DnaA [Endozoicomonadaceae bacterium]